MIKINQAKKEETQLETRFWELLVGYFGAGVSVVGVSETKWEELFSGIWRAVTLAEGFLAGKRENLVKGVFTGKGVIEVTDPTLKHGAFRVSVSSAAEWDATETLMVGLARIGWGVKRLDTDQWRDLGRALSDWHRRGEPATADTLPGLVDAARAEERASLRPTCVHGRAAGWDRAVPCPHCAEERAPIVGQRTPTEPAPAPSKVRTEAAGVLYDRAQRTLEDLARLFAQRYAIGRDNLLLALWSCLSESGLVDVTGSKPPTASALTPSLPSDRASACELLLRQLSLDLDEADLGAIHNALYDAWSAGHQSALTARIEKIPPDAPTHSSGRCAKCGSWMVSYAGLDNAPPDRCPNCPAPKFEVPDFTGFMVYHPPAPCPTCNGTQIVHVQVGEETRLKRCPTCWPGASGPIASDAIKPLLTPAIESLWKEDVVGNWEKTELILLTLVRGVRDGLLAPRELPEVTSTPELARWRTEYKIACGSSDNETRRIARFLELACKRIEDLEAENYAILEGGQEWEYEAKEAKRRVAELEAKLGFTPGQALPTVDTEIRGAVAEESAALFNWLEKRMRLNSDKSEERTRVFTALNSLALRVVGLCRVP